MKRDRAQLLQNVAECSRIFLGHVRGEEYIQQSNGSKLPVADADISQLDAQENYFIDMVQNSTRGISIPTQLKAKIR